MERDDREPAFIFQNINCVRYELFEYLDLVIHRDTQSLERAGRRVDLVLRASPDRTLDQFRKLLRGGYRLA